MAADHRLISAWLSLLKAVEGSAEAMEAVVSLGSELTRDQLAELIARARAPRRTTTDQQLERIWQILGVVPRQRYDQLFRRYETLRVRLEEAEATIQELRQLMDQKGREAEVRDLLDAWASAVSDTLKIHGRFLRSLTGLGQPSEPRRARPARKAPARPKGRTRPRGPSS